jgi:hypothetical protein
MAIAAAAPQTATELSHFGMLRHFYTLLDRDTGCRLRIHGMQLMLCPDAAATCYAVQLSAGPTTESLNKF